MAEVLPSPERLLRTSPPGSLSSSRFPHPADYARPVPLAPMPAAERERRARRSEAWEQRSWGEQAVAVGGTSAGGFFYEFFGKPCMFLASAGYLGGWGPSFEELDPKQHIRERDLYEAWERGETGGEVGGVAVDAVGGIFLLREGFRALPRALSGLRAPPTLEQAVGVAEAAQNAAVRAGAAAAEAVRGEAAAARVAAEASCAPWRSRRGSVLLPFQGSKLRSRMGPPPAGMRKPQAHHDLPEAFQREFQKAGLDIEDPAFGRWVEGGPVGGHQKWSKEFNDKWTDFFERPTDPTKEQIIEKMKELRANPKFQ